MTSNPKGYPAKKTAHLERRARAEANRKEIERAKLAGADAKKKARDIEHQAIIDQVKAETEVLNDTARAAKFADEVTQNGGLAPIPLDGGAQYQSKKAKIETFLQPDGTIGQRWALCLKCGMSSAFCPCMGPDDTGEPIDLMQRRPSPFPGGWIISTPHAGERKEWPISGAQREQWPISCAWPGLADVEKVEQFTAEALRLNQREYIDHTNTMHAAMVSEQCWACGGTRPACGCEARAAAMAPLDPADFPPALIESLCPGITHNFESRPRSFIQTLQNAFGDLYEEIEAEAFEFRQAAGQLVLTLYREGWIHDAIALDWLMQSQAINTNDQAQAFVDSFQRGKACCVKITGEISKTWRESNEIGITVTCHPGNPKRETPEYVTAALLRQMMNHHIAVAVLSHDIDQITAEAMTFDLDGTAPTINALVWLHKRFQTCEGYRNAGKE